MYIGAIDFFWSKYFYDKNSMAVSKKLRKYFRTLVIYSNGKAGT